MRADNVLDYPNRASRDRSAVDFPRPSLVGTPAPSDPPYRGPVSTGRPGRFDHCDHDPGYSAGRKPAIASAARLVGGRDPGAAVHADLRGIRHAEGFEAGAELAGRQEASVGVEVLGRRRADRAGDVAGPRVDRLRVTAVALGGAGVEEHAGGRRARAAASVSSVGSRPYRSVTVPGTVPAPRPAESGSPAARQARPGTRRAARTSRTPAWRSSHQARAAERLPSRRRPRRVAVVQPPAAGGGLQTPMGGSGWRPSARLAVAGEFGVEVDVGGPWDVPGLVARAARAGRRASSAHRAADAAPGSPPAARVRRLQSRRVAVGGARQRRAAASSSAEISVRAAQRYPFCDSLRPAQGSCTRCPF